MREIITNSAAETEEAGKWLAGFVKDGDIIAYRGGLGMGKTTFTRGLAAGLGIEVDVSSPTFTLINEYRGERKRLCHVDAYRLHGADDLFETGFYDYVDAGWVAAVEWSEGIMLDAAFTVSFERLDDNIRKITFEGRGL